MGGLARHTVSWKQQPTSFADVIVQRWDSQGGDRVGKVEHWENPGLGVRPPEPLPEPPLWLCVSGVTYSPGPEDWEPGVGRSGFEVWLCPFLATLSGPYLTLH